MMILLTAFVLGVPMWSAQESRAGTNKREPVEVTEACLHQIGKGEVDAAIDGLPIGGAWDRQKLDLIKRQIKAGIGLYGSFLGIEKVREERHTPSLVRIVYLMKFDNHFYVWNLAFYRPKDRWELSAIAFLDQLTALQ